MTRIVNTLWIGSQLGDLHSACLRSFLNFGYQVVIHTYGKLEDAPKGVTFFDASLLMPESEIVRHKSSGSFALASDKYRYRIQREGLGVYVDADIYCVHELPSDDFLIGYEADDRANGAVLRIPHSSVFLSDVLKASEDAYFIPDWISSKRKLRDKFRAQLGFPRNVSRRPWGTIGPDLLTHLIKKHQLHSIVKPIDILYPLHAQQISLLFERGRTVKDLTTSSSVTIHLYNNLVKGKEIFPDTPLYEILHS